MALDFAKSPGADTSYPQKSYDGQEDQSYGFQPAFKLQTGNMRGTQGVGYGGVKIDGAHNRIQLDANDTQVTIGDTSDTDNLTGVALYDPATQKNVVTLGKDVTSGNETTGLTAYDSSGTRRLLAGTYPDGNIKIKLSQTGYDVATATDDQLIWSSDFNMLKIVKTGTLNVPAVSAPALGSQSIASAETNTGVLSPSPLASSSYILSGGFAYPLPYLFTVATGAGAYSGIAQEFKAYTRVSAGNIIFGVTVINTDIVSTTATTVKYYIFKETAQ